MDGTPCPASTRPSRCPAHGAWYLGQRYQPADPPPRHRQSGQHRGSLTSSSPQCSGSGSVPSWTRTDGPPSESASVMRIPRDSRAERIVSSMDNQFTFKASSVGRAWPPTGSHNRPGKTTPSFMFLWVPAGRHRGGRTGPCVPMRPTTIPTSANPLVSVGPESGPRSIR